ncbi:UDP-glucose 4-epimerase GalE [Pararhizobium mangrovi]|uniref:UDP-glucose 4-epimerase n=1 Tax=Pararhizobium mangrovi TaxID=2590452 RepID=A0A506TZR4_9HYPH|nr:UDP-glucose 4-epimerase GalE [Pararhizobium mangrovi]TPW27573.1 UDP-glucose 4-epimerase GalE [Pararhizobium mangrovi]
MTILVTGGAGYIGSHTVLALLEAGNEVVVVDSLVNANAESLRRVCALAGRHVPLERGDVRDRAFMETVLRRYGCTAVVHFAGLKAVGQSVAEPLDYYEVNVAGTVSLLQAMRASGVRSFVFSSSATVYGEPQVLPIPENHPFAPASPYGRSKAMVEEILADLAGSEAGWHIATLRYFNPVGAHESGAIGEAPSGIPDNLMPYVAKVAGGKLSHLRVFGNDYPTPDGTGVRDYIHVVDLAEGHVRALDHLAAGPGHFSVNLGTGRGTSVLELVAAFRHASNREIPCEIVERRPGDIAEYYADPALAGSLFGWQAKRSVREMCADTWNWQSKNPNGYDEA